MHYNRETGSICCRARIIFIMLGIVSCLHVRTELAHYNLPLQWKKRINMSAGCERGRDGCSLEL